jgi:hypothetical protein
MKIKESHAKYLAGLLDADGWFGFSWKTPEKAYRRMTLRQNDERILKWIEKNIGIGWFTKDSWTVSSNSDLNLLMPHILKHMVIKARLWEWVYTTDAPSKDEWRRRRLHDVGPLRHKKHPTWAWVAGYIDGDGWIAHNKRKDTIGYTTRVGALCHHSDRIAVELLHKAFGGNLCEKSEGVQWQRGLGKQHRSFAKMFLSRLVPHLVRKRHKAELILQYHSQRLSEDTPKGEAIV